MRNLTKTKYTLIHTLLSLRSVSAKYNIIHINQSSQICSAAHLFQNRNDLEYNCVSCKYLLVNILTELRSNA